jgi:hypothetical protein
MQYGVLKIRDLHDPQRTRDLPLTSERVDVGSDARNAVVLDDPAAPVLLLQLLFKPTSAELVVVDTSVSVTFGGRTITLSGGDSMSLNGITLIRFGQTMLIWTPSQSKPQRPAGQTPLLGIPAAAPTPQNHDAELAALLAVPQQPSLPAGTHIADQPTVIVKAPAPVVQPAAPALVPPSEPTPTPAAQRAQTPITGPMPSAQDTAAPALTAPATGTIEFTLIESPDLQIDAGKRNTAQVEPGRTIAFTGVITNRTALNDEPEVIVDGLPASWCMVKISRPRLFKDDSTDVHIVIKPEREPASLAGPYPVRLIAAFKAQASVRQVCPLTLTVLPYNQFEVLSLETPQNEKVGWAGGRFLLPIRNSSNYPRAFAVKDASQPRVLGLGFVPPRIDIDAGDTRTVQVVTQVPLRARAWTGAEKSFPFELAVEPLGVEEPLRKTTGVLPHTPLLPAWLVALMLWVPAVIGVLVCALLVMLRFFPESAPAQVVATQIAGLQPTSIATPAATASAAPSPELTQPSVAPPTLAPLPTLVLPPTVDIVGTLGVVNKNAEGTQTAIVGKSDAEKTAAIAAIAATFTSVAQTQAVFGTTLAQTVTVQLGRQYQTQTAYVSQLTQTSIFASETARAWTATPTPTHTPTVTPTPAADRIITFDTLNGVPVTQRTQLDRSAFIEQNVSICFFGLEGEIVIPTDTPVPVTVVVTVNIPTATSTPTVTPSVTPSFTPTPITPTVTAPIVVRGIGDTPTPALATLAPLGSPPGEAPTIVLGGLARRQQADAMENCRPPDILVQSAGFISDGEYFLLDGRRMQRYTPAVYPRLSGVNVASNFLTADQGQNEFLPGLFGVVTFQFDVVEARLSIFNPSPTNVEYVIYGLDERGIIVAQSPRALAVPGPFTLIASSANSMRQVVITVPLESIRTNRARAQTPLIITRVEINERRR